MRTIYHIEFWKTGLWMSWWEKCMIENIKYFISKKEKNILLTTDNWKTVYEKNWLFSGTYFDYRIINSYEYEKKHHIFLSYINRVWKSIKLIKELKLSKDDIIFCHSDFFPNTIPTYYLSKKYKKNNYFYYLHILLPGILSGFEWAFTNTRKIPNINFIHHKLNQVLFFYLLKDNATVINVNPYYNNKIKKRLSKDKLLYTINHFWWIDKNIKIDKNENKIKYDLVWMWRFQSIKWIQDYLKLVYMLKSTIPNIKACVIWWGNINEEKEFYNTIEKLWIQSNVFFQGKIHWVERFKLVQQSKVFINTSKYESYWLVNLESLSLWVPVVCYELWTYDVFSKWVVKSEIGNIDKIKDNILMLLNDSKLRLKYSEEAKEFSKKFSWENTWEEIYQLF